MLLQIWKLKFNWEELIKGKDEKAQGTIVRIPKTNCLVTWAINKLFPIGYMNQSNNLEDITLNKERPKQEEAISLEGVCMIVKGLIIKKKDWGRIYCSTWFLSFFLFLKSVNSS